MINRGSISALLAPNLRRVFFETGKRRAKEYTVVFNVAEMETNPLTDQNMAGLGTMPGKPEGTQFVMDEPIIGNTKSYTATPYGMGVEITFEAWRDELYGTIEEMIRGLKDACDYRQEVDAWAVFNNAFTSGTGFDATYLCATSHTKLDASTWSNRPTVDVGLSITGLQGMIIDFEGLSDDRGIPRVQAPSLLLIHAHNKFVAREIFGSGGKPFTAQNEINSILEEDLRYMVCHHLTSQTAWFAGVNPGDHDVNFLWRDYPIFDCYDDPTNKNAVATAYQRFTVGFGSSKGWWGTTG